MDYQAFLKLFVKIDKVYIKQMMNAFSGIKQTFIIIESDRDITFEYKERQYASIPEHPDQLKKIKPVTELGKMLIFNIQQENDDDESPGDIVRPLYSLQNIHIRYYIFCEHEHRLENTIVAYLIYSSTGHLIDRNTMAALEMVEKTQNKQVVPQIQEIDIGSHDVLITNTNVKSELLQDCECPICIENPSDPSQFPCGHIICRKCINQALKHELYECPVCRGFIYASISVVYVLMDGDTI